MTPEAKTKKRIKAILAARGAWYCMPMGTGYGKSGVADFVVCVNGFFLAIEAKAGKGRTTALQDRELLRIREAGGYPLVIYDTEEDFKTLDNVLEALKQRNRHETI